MKKKIATVITILVFLIVGELLMRFNKAYDILNDKPQGIEVKIEESKLKTAIDNNTFALTDNQLRILVIGDSYINGGGINSEKKFSKKLREILNKESKLNQEIQVLDISRPSNNTVDNYTSYLYYQARFNPQFVFWAYNFNDVLGSFKVEENNENQIATTLILPPKRAKQQSRNKLKAFVKKSYSKSELLRYVSSNLQKELKLKGFVLPLGDFYFLTSQGYKENNVNWIKTQQLFDNVAKISKDNNAQFILYRMPEFNLLERPELFYDLNSTIENYTQSRGNLMYLNGADDFPNDNGSDFMISRYDGHPNALAHEKIANSIAKIIKLQLKNTN